jgi:hypothetical protein
MKVLARVACVVSAVAALFLSYLAAEDLYLTGFPDGHLTDHDKAVDMPKHILMWVESGFVAVFWPSASSGSAPARVPSDCSPP